MTNLAISGRFLLVSRDPHGRVLAIAPFNNGVTTEGINHLLNRVFRGGAGFSTWYGGLIDNTGSPVLAAADTHVSHPGWSEWTGVFGSNRATWVPVAAAGGNMASANMVFSITASGTVRGALLASQQAIGSASGQVLYATGLADAGVPVVNGGTVTLSYIIRLTPR